MIIIDRIEVERDARTMVYHSTGGDVDWCRMFGEGCFPPLDDDSEFGLALDDFMNGVKSSVVRVFVGGKVVAIDDAALSRQIAELIGG